MSGFLQTHKLVLTPLSPIHIGSGHDLDWTSAVLVGREMLLFDPMRVELPADALKKLGEAANGSDGAKAIQRLQQLMQTHRRAFAQARTGSIALTAGIAQEIAGKAGKNTQRGQGGGENIVNALQIARCAVNPATEQPMVPGSSLKGALRTAVVANKDAKGDGRPRPPERKNGRDVYPDPSDKLLGSFANSPFSRLFLSDLLPVDGVKSLVAKVANERRRYKETSGSGVPVTVELIRPFQPGAFRGDIRLGGARGHNDKSGSLSLAPLLQTTHRFHLDLFAFFSDVLQQERRGLPDGWLEAVQALLAEPVLAKAVQEGRAALVRLGKYCSAESKTVAWRSVRIPQAKSADQQQVLNPYTIWLADLGAEGKLPLGWALIELADEPSPEVRAFCARFQPPPEPEPEIPPLPPIGPRIVEDRSTANGKRMGLLEDGYDDGKANDAALENIIKQSKNWPPEDRLILAQLVKEKARSNSKLGFKWKDLDKLLLPLTP